MNSLSRVIKAQHARGDSWCIVGELSHDENGGQGGTDSTQVLLDAEQQAEALIQHAQLEAQSLVQSALAEAKQQAEELLEEARREGLEQGFQEGFQKGLAEAEQRNQHLASRLVSLLDATEREQQRLLSEAETDLVDLALTIARQIIATELTIRPQIITEIVARAIEEARSSGHHTIRLHPEDAEIIRQYLPEAAIEAGGNRWEIRAEESLSRGDCVVDTAFGQVDARIETQLAELKQALIGQGDDV